MHVADEPTTAPPPCRLVVTSAILDAAAWPRDRGAVGSSKASRGVLANDWLGSSIRVPSEASPVSLQCRRLSSPG